MWPLRLHVDGHLLVGLHTLDGNADVFVDMKMEFSTIFAEIVTIGCQVNECCEL